MNDAMYSSERRVAFKGQVFSAPMDWAGLQKQLQLMDKNETPICLPITGEVLMSRVRLSITSGLVDLNKHMREATVRRDIVVQLIRMHKDAGHPDYQSINMEDVKVEAQKLAPTDDPTIPNGLFSILDSESDEALDDDVDKAATPAVRIWNEEELQNEMQRARPQLILGQRDSDAQKDVESSRANALAGTRAGTKAENSSAFTSHPELELQTSSSLMNQFQSSYIPRVFNLSLPWCVGGPDFPHQKRWRRCYEDAPAVSLDMFTEMMSTRVEANIRWDWDMNPALWSLSFASKVNQGAAMSIKRCLRRSTDVETQGDKNIGQATARILLLLEHGSYIDNVGRVCKVRGDVSKITQMIGLTPQQKTILRNYHFMSSRLPGTRQVRRSINHYLFSARVVYGTPTFITVTPSERHSGLCIHLFRYRKMIQL